MDGGDRAAPRHPGRGLGAAWLPDRSSRDPALLVAAAGLWAVLSTIAIVCVVVRWPPGFGWAGYPPFYPVLLGPFAWTIAVGTAVTGDRMASGWRWWLGWAMAALTGPVAATALCARMWLKAPPVPEPIDAARRVLQTITEGGPATVAVLSHDRINLDTLAFYEAQHRPLRPRLRRFRWTPPSSTGGSDFTYRLPPGGDVKRHRQALLDQIREGADFVVVHGDPAHYAQPPTAWGFFLFEHGAPVAEALLSDPEMKAVARYALPGTGDHVVLRNERRWQRRRRQVR